MNEFKVLRYLVLYESTYIIFRKRKEGLGIAFNIWRPLWNNDQYEKHIFAGEAKNRITHKYFVFLKIISQI